MKSTKSPSTDININLPGLHASCHQDQKLPPQGDQAMSQVLGGGYPSLRSPQAATFNEDDTCTSSRPSKKPKTSPSLTSSLVAASSTYPLPSLQAQATAGSLQIFQTTTNSVAASAGSAMAAPAVPCNSDLSAAYITTSAAGLPFHQTRGQGINNDRTMLPPPSSAQHYANGFVTQLNIEEALLIERLKLQHYRNLLLERTKQEEEKRNQVLAPQPDPSLITASIAGSSCAPVPHNMGGAGFTGLDTGVTCQDLRLSPSALRFVAEDFKLSPCNPTSKIPDSAVPTAGTLESLPRCLLLSIDEKKISKYQCLLRKHIEAFEASQDDIETHSRGRSRKIVVGQVGIRCRHCRGYLAKGSLYFPGTLSGIYQSAQNMALHHIYPRDEATRCKAMPAEDVSQFQTLLSSKSNVGGGKDYWSEAANMIGLVDTPHGIRFIGRQPVSKAA